MRMLPDDRSRYLGPRQKIELPEQPSEADVSSAFDCFARKRHLRSPLLREIFPPRILRLDQSYLLRSRPALQLLFPSNRPVNFIEALVITQPIASILAGKPLDLPTLMLQGAPVNAVGHTDVKRS